MQTRCHSFLERKPGRRRACAAFASCISRSLSVRSCMASRSACCSAFRRSNASPLIRFFENEPFTSFLVLVVAHLSPLVDNPLGVGMAPRAPPRPLSAKRGGGGSRLCWCERNKSPAGERHCQIRNLKFVIFKGLRRCPWRRTTAGISGPRRAWTALDARSWARVAGGISRRRD